MSIGIVAKLRCKEGANAQFEAGFKELQQAVKDNEPGCIFYLCSNRGTIPPPTSSWSSTKMPTHWGSTVNPTPSRPEAPNSVRFPVADPKLS